MTELMLGDLFTGQLVRLAADQTPEFREAMARWNEDAEFMRLLDDDPAFPYSLASIEAQDHKNRGTRNFDFAVRTLADDKLIGFGGVGTQGRWNLQNGWIGIGIGELDYRGKGYGTDTMRLLVGYGFRELGLYRVTLSVFSYNLRAIRSYEKVGFVREQVQRSALLRDGQRHDLYIMGLLRSDWEAAQT